MREKVGNVQTWDITNFLQVWEPLRCTVIPNVRALQSWDSGGWLWPDVIMGTNSLGKPFLRTVWLEYYISPRQAGEKFSHFRFSFLSSQEQHLRRIHKGDISKVGVQPKSGLLVLRQFLSLRLRIWRGFGSIRWVENDLKRGVVEDHKKDTLKKKITMSIC